MNSENKKVKNATALTVNGISFKSTIEARVYRKLLDNGIVPEYEPDKVVLQKGFKPSHIWFADGKLQSSKVRDITYTPDFKFEYNGFTVYLEVKGFITDRYPLKRKMFLASLESDFSDVVFAEVKTLSGLSRTLEQISELTKQPGYAG